MTQTQTDIESVKYMDLAEFVSRGFLQEANRQFFHPLGLALEVEVADDGAVRLSGIWDYRDDPEGIVFARGAIDVMKIVSVLSEEGRHLEARDRLFGARFAGIQPLGWVDPDGEQHTEEACREGRLASGPATPYSDVPGAEG